MSIYDLCVDSGEAGIEVKKRLCEIERVGEMISSQIVAIIRQ